MVKIYAIKKGQTGKEAPKPGDVTEAIGQVLAYAKRKEAKEAQKAEAAPIDWVALTVSMYSAFRDY